MKKVNIPYKISSETITGNKKKLNREFQIKIAKGVKASK